MQVLGTEGNETFATWLDVIQTKLHTAVGFSTLAAR
jgi:hypothetical protein